MGQAKVIAIAAIGRDRGLGKGNDLIFKIPEDMQHFRDTTKGHPVITGRKNFAAMGRALPGRPTIIVTRDTSFVSEGSIVVHSIEEAIMEARKLDQEKIFIIGGGEIYKAALPYTDELNLTIIDAERLADIFFPDYSDFKKVISTEEHKSQGLSYAYTVLER